MPEQQVDYVLRVVEDRRIRFVQLWFTDVLGRHKAFHVTPAELEDVLDEGMTFDGSAIDGFSRVQEADVLAKPDLDTFQVLPWPHDGGDVARVVCDIATVDGEPFEGCPRNRLRRVLGAAREEGYTFYVAPELEFFYLEDLEPTGVPRPVDRGSYFDLGTDHDVGRVRRETVRTLEEMGIPVEHAQHEDAPGQHELDLRYTDALTMADTVMTVRHVVKELARGAGIAASFMPKPIEGVQGSGMHTHLSLWRDEVNAFVDPDGRYGLSELATRFIAGLLVHAGELTAVTNQWVNSYKRLVPGHEAPVHVSWARNNRSALVRVPTVKATKSESTRVEYRAPDAAVNPYLCFAVLLAAGMAGVRGGYELPEEATGNLFDRGAGRDLELLPTTLKDATDRMAGSTLLHDTLGEHLVEWFLRNKRAEWSAYAETVTPFELDRYLPLL